MGIFHAIAGLVDILSAGHASVLRLCWWEIDSARQIVEASVSTLA